MIPVCVSVLHKGTNPNRPLPLYYLHLVAASCSY